MGRGVWSRWRREGKKGKEKWRVKTEESGCESGKGKEG